LLCHRFDELRSTGLSLSQAARALGKSPSWFSGSGSMYERWRAEGSTGLVNRASDKAHPRLFQVPTWFVPAARFFWLSSNRNWKDGSVPEAIRRTISLPLLPQGWDRPTRGRLLKSLGLDQVPECPEHLRELILARQKAGRPLVPDRLARQIRASEAAMRTHRHRKEAALDYYSAPGTTMWNDRGEFYRAGDLVEADDGTINFPVVIPWTIGGCPCSDKWGVKVGRFQWLRTRDVGSRYRPGYVYTARPRSSYRGEDVLALVRSVCRAHGIPRGWRLERGVWESRLVAGALKLLGCETQHVWSPHQKPFIEGGFDQDWTKLSVQFPGCDLGRFAGDTAEANQFLQACRAGAHDPRRYFPTLGQAIAAFDQITAEENATPIQSALYGRWVPSERWAEQLDKNPLRPLDPANEWMFSPYIRDWKVKGMLVGGRVPLFEGLSVPFDFSSGWLCELHGARVRCYFDPSEPTCSATVVLLQDWGTHKAGEVLGAAPQINQVAGYARLVLGWGDDPAGAGRRARQVAAAAVRREIRTILPAGDHGPATSEERDGLSTVTRIESHRPDTTQDTPSGRGSSVPPTTEPAARSPQPPLSRAAAWRARQLEID
jgi:hypothetical protein